MDRAEPGADPFANFASHRLLAADLYKRCLRENSTLPLQNFLEILITVHPPPMALLHAIHDDIGEQMHRLLQAQYNASLSADGAGSSEQDDAVSSHRLQLTRLLKETLADWLRALCILQAHHAQAENPTRKEAAGVMPRIFTWVL